MGISSGATGTAAERVAARPENAGKTIGAPCASLLPASVAEGVCTCACLWCDPRCPPCVACRVTGTERRGPARRHGRGSSGGGLHSSSSAAGVQRAASPCAAVLNLPLCLLLRRSVHVFSVMVSSSSYSPALPNCRSCDVFVVRGALPLHRPVRRSEEGGGRAGLRAVGEFFDLQPGVCASAARCVWRAALHDLVRIAGCLQVGLGGAGCFA